MSKPAGKVYSLLGAVEATLLAAAEALLGAIDAPLAAVEATRAERTREERNILQSWWMSRKSWSIERGDGWRESGRRGWGKREEEERTGGKEKRRRGPWTA